MNNVSSLFEFFWYYGVQYCILQSIYSLSCFFLMWWVTRILFYLLSEIESMTIFTNFVLLGFIAVLWSLCFLFTLHLKLLRTKTKMSNRGGWHTGQVEVFIQHHSLIKFLVNLSIYLVLQLDLSVSPYISWSPAFSTFFTRQQKLHLINNCIVDLFHGSFKSFWSSISVIQLMR